MDQWLGAMAHSQLPSPSPPPRHLLPASHLNGQTLLSLSLLVSWARVRVGYPRVLGVSR